MGGCVDFPGGGCYVFNMDKGTIVEFIERKKIICAIVMQTKKQKVRLLTELNREASISENRLFCHDGTLDPDIGRDRLVALLSEIAKNRDSLKAGVDVEELWEVLNTEAEWIDAETMAEFAFGRTPEPDYVSAVTRALFEDRVHFKFDITRFFPNSPEIVEQLVAQAEREARRKRIIEKGVAWVRDTLASENGRIPPDMEPTVEILKSFYLFDKDSQDPETARDILSKAGMETEQLFSFLVRIGTWDEDVNLSLFRLGVPIEFSGDVLDRAVKVSESPGMFVEPCQRRDLTSLPLLTIDGQSTQDFDDAISFDKDGDAFRVGVHISDVAHFIKKGDPFDEEARLRGSSIYMPDDKIPMLPPDLAEGLLSLKAGQVRPALSVMARLDTDANVLDFEVCTSLIRVQRQLSYNDANQMAGADKEIIALVDLAEKLRQKRLDAGALLLALPEINIWINEKKEISLHRIKKESGSRTVVSEFMILANSLMAEFLEKNNSPAVFRSQPMPKKRLFERDQGTLYQNWMQRRHLSRFYLSCRGEPHSGIGTDAYVTGTSPIRKYLDLITQRQVRGILGIEKA